MLPVRRQRKKGRVEIIPMIDVMLFLLVFFIMITLQMITDKGLKLQLPSSSEAKVLPHPHFVLNILKDGVVEVKGKKMDLQALTGFLATDGDVTHTQVTIAADKLVPFKDFVHVMDACQKAGVTAIGIATKAT
ncbi:biopolymer transporter ExbD [Acidithiobacillus sp. CV18-2]|uniref:Biopolymer transporter ExbD n=1 Tax=Igneacidithiobacillus copahuensis TaxID=2724909 RepID=A0AAE2YQ69_9PROT|nr:biopolymer transporter ExbD [Igneacidithiobacillus copahuensis]MBU2753138.1 biopolymer transporter ExbD [Acidithiobacillus sp. CV18-3]MBU2756714.1 biopolymer transporter ExbD [Acidithiobacillus sp. BN09-2]MBU2776599.1 biopolymer transporter ExbD [Acidithiobacillus sp. CV18-2]MBU2796972.1 biopolymer transporter ExbD [Acidithiobacillus sp. VAN18-2]MBU2798200.1 biopolymer transporter ExbD [Acidithiobacillus sp. VAN18-4]UTV80455.1 biopolymer transporter ExbD [Acidithiobacillus sp. YTS05]